MKRLLSVILCVLILLSCTVPALAADGVPKEVMDATKSVVRILSEYKRDAATGSGFVIKNDGTEILIATNNHVVDDDPKRISVWVGENRQVDAEIVFTTSAKDLCVLRLTEYVDMAPLTLSKEDAQHGAAIYVVGYPGAGDVLSDTQAHTSDSVTITDGIISAIRTFTIEKGASPVKLLQVNAAINAGNSGGPLFNTKGEVIGVNTYKVNVDSQGVFGSVDISELWALLEEHKIYIEEAEESIPFVYAEKPGQELYLKPILIAAGGAILLLAVICLAGSKKKKTAKRSASRNQKSVPLKEHMARYPGGLGIGGAVSTLLPVAIRLRNLHNDGRLHLQVCPENVLLGSDGAVLKEPGGQESGRFNNGFAAPEIYRGSGFGITSDVYSFAALLLYTATGKVPANSLQPEALEQDLALLDNADFAGILRRAMAPGTADRIQSMQELIYGIAVYNVPVEEKQPVKAAVAQRVEQAAPKMEEKKETSLPEEKREAPKPRKQAAPRKKAGKLLPVAEVLACGIVAVVLLWNPSVKQEDITVSAEQESAAAETTEPLTHEGIAYAEAEQLLVNGETAKAAIAFGKLGDYRDARERSLALWDEVAVRDTIVGMADGTAGLKSDGTVLLVGDAPSKFSHDRQHWKNMKENVNAWSDVIAISGYRHLLGLKEDGSVIITGADERHSDLMEWEDIVSVSAAWNLALGLKMDGTVLVSFSGNTQDERFAWIPELSEWTDIVAVSTNAYHAVGLRADGTVVAAGEPNAVRFWTGIEQWRDIVAVEAGCSGGIFGLKADGTLESVGPYQINGDWYEKGKCDVSQWTDIVALTTGGKQIIGVKSDGSVVAVGYNLDGCLSVTKWKDIVAVDFGDSGHGRHTVGLQSDGTMVAVGANTYGQCRVKDWFDIKLPN